MFPVSEVSFLDDDRDKRERQLSQLEGYLSSLTESISSNETRLSKMLEGCSEIVDDATISSWKNEIHEFEKPSETQQQLSDFDEMVKIVEELKKLRKLSSSEAKRQSQSFKGINLVPQIVSEIERNEEKSAVEVSENSILLKKVKGDSQFFKVVLSALVSSNLKNGGEIVVITQNDFIKICFGEKIQSFDEFVDYLKSMLTLINDVIQMYGMSEDCVLDVTPQLALVLSKAREGCGESEFDKEWNDEVITDVFKSDLKGFVWKKIIYMLFMEKNLMD
ncbi:hypothetical protein EIN_273640 [Entamoeba invadens IP1]|uniref:Uncharacterized protein n=1 Tax=Entamoeba invadens IP1 TaxID=370355 RepID=A0A0A1U1E0_ENTIV|nr:hypothetical protein EIN_273640 [Entamoeba invadens IP1]ELP87827.1 hypothetical protein EIN_273640 [Entamoeba invadens IP1]|eukprot:XP_004254598.1 hypothetical protein EIN_273640 [Entamoeba invadens IP1]